jgi:hypothetical protein
VEVKSAVAGLEVTCDVTGLRVTSGVKGSEEGCEGQRTGWELYQ